MVIVIAATAIARGLLRAQLAFHRGWIDRTWVAGRNLLNQHYVVGIIPTFFDTGGYANFPDPTGNSFQTIGVALDAWMLYPNWIRGQTQPEVVGLVAVADHIDHVCQLAGDAEHSAIGSDLDGGFSIEQTPRDRAQSHLNRNLEVVRSQHLCADQDQDQRQAVVQELEGFNHSRQREVQRT